MCIEFLVALASISHFQPLPASSGREMFGELEKKKQIPTGRLRSLLSVIGLLLLLLVHLGATQTILTIGHQ